MQHMLVYMLSFCAFFNISHAVDVELLSKVNAEVNKHPYCREVGQVWDIKAACHDCEEYALKKWLALKQAGVSPQDMELRHCTTWDGQAHTVLAVDGWVLDNRTNRLLKDKVGC